MRAIYKYELEITDVQEILMLRDAELLHVAMQGEKLCLWAGVNPLHGPDDTEARRFRVAGTGHGIAEGLTYVGTALDTRHTLGGASATYVWHVLEVPTEGGNA
jgi:hypothetical protein